MAVDELDKATALARRNFDIGDFAKALKERPQLVFGDVARQAPDKDCRVVRVCELIHRLGHHGVEWLLVVVLRHRPVHSILSRGRGHHLVLRTILVRATPASNQLGELGTTATPLCIPGLGGGC